MTRRLAAAALGALAFAACGVTRPEAGDGGWSGWSTADGGGQDGGAGDAGDAGPPEPPAPAAALAATMNYTVDGDTIDVYVGSGSFRVRVWGIDTPELNQPHYQDAKDLTRDLLPSARQVTLGFDRAECAVETPPSICRDSYNRVLAYVASTDGDDLGSAQLFNGLAVVYEHCNCSRHDFYKDVEAGAKARGIGIWSP